MKKILTIITYFWIVNLYGQRVLNINYNFNTKTYEYNYAGNIGKPTYLHSKDKISLKIQNINQLIFDIAFAKEVKTYHTATPKIPGLSDFPFINTNEVVFTSTVGASYRDFERTYRQVQYDLDTINNTLIKFNDWLVEVSDFANLSSALEYFRKQREAFLHNLSELNSEYLEYISIADPKDLITQEVVKLKAAFDAKDIPGIYVNFFQLVENVHLEKIFIYEAPEIIASGDEVAITIDIAPKKDKENLPINAEKLNLSFNVLRRLKWSFSTGVFKSSLVNREYSNRPNLNPNVELMVDTISSYTLIEEKRAVSTYGLAGFFHYTYQFSPSFGAGLNIGGGIDLQEKTQYFLGATLAFGDKDRLLLNGGLSWSQVTVLSDGLNLGSTTLAPVDIKTSQYLNTGYYISLTYNLLK